VVSSSVVSLGAAGVHQNPPTHTASQSQAIASQNQYASQNQAVVVTMVTVVVPQKKCNLTFGCVFDAAIWQILAC
jgi:hypothetical protein